MRRIVAYLFLIALPAALFPAIAFAEDGQSSQGLLVRVQGNVRIPAGETVGTVVVVDGNVVVEGTVRDLLLVISGDATVHGVVEGDIALVSGDLALASTARVNNVSIVRGAFNRDAGAVVSGEVTRREHVFTGGRWAALAFSAVAWGSMTVAVIVAGLVFAAAGGRQLSRTAMLLTAEVGPSLLASAVVWLAAPLVAVLLMVTVIGLPLGAGVLVFLLPTAWFLGYLVAGVRIGGWLVGIKGRAVPDHPYLATFVGLGLMQLVLLLPVLGALIVILAGAWGAGGLALSGWRASRGLGAGPTVPAPTAA